MEIKHLSVCRNPLFRDCFYSKLLPLSRARSGLLVAHKISPCPVYPSISRNLKFITHVGRALLFSVLVSLIPVYFLFSSFLDNLHRAECVDDAKLAV